MNIFPQTVSAKNIQRDYRKVFDLAKKTKEPVIVLTNNKPDVAIIDVKQLEVMHKKVYEVELAQALRAIKIYKREKKAGKLKVLNSLKDLM